MKYSIIIAVYNRLEEVKELLESAEKLDGDRSLFELLFVDDGSKDGFKEFIEQYHSTSGLQIRAIYQKNQGPGAARNQGMSKAQGEYFIFVDSDCMFPPQWLTEIEKAQNEHHYDAFGGPDTCHPSFSPLLKAINYSMTSFIGTGGTRGNKKHVGRFYPRSFNMGISREVYNTIGGMGGLRHGQDMDYSMRIYNAGFKVGLIADAYVYHKRRTSIPKFFRQYLLGGCTHQFISTPSTYVKTDSLASGSINHRISHARNMYYLHWPTLSSRTFFMEYYCLRVNIRLPVCFLSISFQISEHHCCLSLHHHFAHPSLRLRIRITLGRLECPTRKGSEGFFKKLLRKKL